MPRHVLVTGGAGFVGSHLVDLLVTEGADVSVVDDLSRGRHAWLHPDAELHQIDLRDPDAVRGAIEATRPDAVVHLAALHFIPAVDGAPELAWEINVTGTRVVADALAGHPPELLLFASTAAVYPDRAGPIAETCTVGPVDLYGRTKVEGERIVTALEARTGTRPLIARLFNVIGPRETNPHVIPEVVAQLRGGDTVVRLGNVETRRDYTDVRDVADALRRLLAVPRDAPSTLNIGSGRSVSVVEVVELCGEILGRPLEIESEPRRRRAQDRAELVADPRLLHETTGWQPRVPLRETLTALLDEPDPLRS